MFRFILASICAVFLLSTNTVFAQGMSKEQEKVWKKRQKSMSVEEFKKKVEGYETATDEAYKLERQVVTTSQVLAKRERRIDSLEKALASYQTGKEGSNKTSKPKKKKTNEIDTENVSTQIADFNASSKAQTFDTNEVNTDDSFTEGENITDLNSDASATEDQDDYSEGTVYRVQVGAFRNKDLMKFVGHRRFHAEEDADGVKKYTIAAFRDYWEADLFKKYMREMGVKDAWIVAYKDNIRVQIESVLSAENQEIVKAGDSKNSDVD